MSKLEAFLQKKRDLENTIAFYDTIIDESNHFSIKSGSFANWGFQKGDPLYDDILQLMYIERHKLNGELLDIKCTIFLMEKLL